MEIDTGKLEESKLSFEWDRISVKAIECLIYKSDWKWVMPEIKDELSIRMCI